MPSCTSIADDGSPSIVGSRAGRGTIRKAHEIYPLDTLVGIKRYEDGLCVTCSTQLFEVTQTGGRRKLNPVTTPGASFNGRCLYCHPNHEPPKEKTEAAEQNWEDAATIQLDELASAEHKEDQSSPPVVVVDGYGKKHFLDTALEGNTAIEAGEVESIQDKDDQSPSSIKLNGYTTFFHRRAEYFGVASEGNPTKGKGVFSHVVKRGSSKGNLIVYDGEFADGHFEGRGFLFDKRLNLVVSKGQWQKSKLHGQGTHRWATGDCYEGNWKNGQVHGVGKKDYKDGSIYEGNWKEGKKDGQGTYLWADGGRYEGEWQYDKKDGIGKMIDKHGNIHEGNWKDDGEIL